MLQEASLHGLIRVLLLLVLVYYGVKVLSRLFAPAILRYVTKKTGQHFEKQFNSKRKYSRSSKKEGDITIDKMPNTNNHSNKDVGEYVDYEEID